MCADVSPTPLPHGTPAWLDMVGRLLCRASQRAGLRPDQTVSLVERYTDGAPLADGLVDGLRFDIVRGHASYRVGVGQRERGDITIEITRAAAHRLNRLKSADPAYAAAVAAAVDSGKMTVTGDPRALGDWLAGAHDEIVERTL